MHDELEAWTKAWRHLETDVVVGTGSPVDLARRQRLHGRLALFGGWLAVAALGVGAFLAYDRCQRPVIMVALGFATGLPIVLMAWYTWLEYRIERAEGTAVGRYLRELRTRTANEAYVCGSWWGTAVVVGFLVGWLPWLAYEDRALYAAEPQRLYGSIVALALILAATVAAQVATGRRHRRRVAALDTLIDELAAGDDA